MKRILFLLLFLPLLAISQVVPPDATPLENIQITNNIQSTTATRATVSENNGVLNYIPIQQLPITNTPINYSVSAPQLGAHLTGIDTRLGQISSTTAGITQRVYFTADNTTVTTGTFFTSSLTGKGSTATGSPPALVLADDTKGYFTKDIISVAFPSATIGYAGSYTGQLTVSASPTPVATQQRFTIEIYRTNNGGTPIASGVSGAPTGDLGVTVVAILDSGIINLTAGSITNIQVAGILTQNITLNSGERLRYHVSAAKIGTGGGSVTFGVYYGTAYNSYYDIPVAITTDAVLNKSTVAGITETDALNNLSVKANFINIKDLGGIGNGVFDNTTIINNALLTYKEVYFPDGNYLVTSLVNDLGAKITGSGIIVKAITGGQQQLNTGIDRYNYVSGQEYLSFVQNKMMALGSKSTAGIKVSWSGDSTTAGDAVSDTGFILSNLFLATARKNSIAAVTSLNRGHSGANTEQWRTTYLASDLAENPDLYIIRWGINDASRGLDAFKTSLRTGLATIRASKSQSQLSIILMSPNSTSDTPNGRDEKWYEQVRKIYIQAARDYKCAFIDTYSLWLDSRGAADVYMDNPYGDGRAIHPFNVFNSWIVSKVFDLVFPTSFKVKVSSGYLINESSADRLPALSDLPESYQKGFSLSRAYQPTGLWAVDGTALTFFNTDGTGLQLNSSRLTDVPEIYFRSFKGEYSTETLSWSNNVRMWHSGNLTNPVTGSSTANFIPKWTGTSSQGNSQIFDNASSVGINTTSPVGKFHVKVATDLNVFFSNSSSKVGVTAVNDAVSLNVPLILNASTVELASSGTTKLTVSGSGTTVNNLTGSGDAATIVDATGLLKRGDAVISGVKRYTITASQSGTSAPVVTVLDNTLGGTVTWSRGSAGSFTGTLSGVFTAGKTVVFANTATTSRIITCGTTSTSTIFFLLQDNSGVPTDGSSQISFKVEVYP